MSTKSDVSADATKVENLTEQALKSHSKEANSKLANELNDLAKDPGIIKSINEQLKNDRSADPSLPKIDISYDSPKSDGWGGGSSGAVEITASQGKVELGGTSASQTTEDLGEGRRNSAQVEESNQPAESIPGLSGASANLTPMVKGGPQMM